MPRRKTDLSLVKKIAQAFKSVGKIQRNGKNTTRHYPFTRASDVLEAVRDKLLSQDVLIHIDEGEPQYVAVATSNGGEQITECRLPVTYTFIDEKDSLKPMRFNGIGRDVEDKSLAKAQTGAQKSLLKRFGLMVEDADEFDGDRDSQDQTDSAQEMREAEAKPARAPRIVTLPQIRAFNDACERTGKSQDEVSGYLLTAHRVSKLCDLGRGKPFTDALKWAARGAPELTLAPKPQAAAAQQGKLPLPNPAPSFEMRVGGKTIEVQPQTGSYSI